MEKQREAERLGEREPVKLPSFIMWWASWPANQLTAYPVKSSKNQGDMHPVAHIVRKLLARP